MEHKREIRDRMDLVWKEGQKVKTVSMTEGALGDKIIRYAIPVAITGILQQLFNAADIAVVGRFCGKEVMAAVGSNAPVVSLLINLFVGISLGSNVIIARSIGQKHKENVEKAVHTSILVALLCGVFMMILGQALTPWIIRLLGVPSDIHAYTAKYLRIYLIGMPVILLYNFETAIFRSCGNVRTPMIALMISGVLNVLFNLFFVLVLHMDADGVAFATVLANLISSGILFFHLLKTDQIVQVRIRKLRIHFDILKQILAVGIPAGIQNMIFSVANVTIQTAVNSLGTTIMAASSAGYNLEVFAYYVLNSFNQACTTFVGQNYGAGKGERCKRTLKLCLLQSLLCTGASCLLILFLARNLLSLFTTDPQVIEYGRIRLIYIFIAYGLSFVQETLSGYLRGFGLSFVPAVIAVVMICGLRLTWVFLVFPMAPSFERLMLIYPISLWSTAIVMMLVTWRLKPSVRYLKKS